MFLPKSYTICPFNFTLTKRVTFLFSPKKFLPLLKNKSELKTHVCSELNYYLFLRRRQRFSTTIHEKEKNIKILLLEENVYENNECVYLKNDKKIIIKNNKDIKCLNLEQNTRGRNHGRNCTKNENQNENQKENQNENQKEILTTILKREREIKEMKTMSNDKKKEIVSNNKKNNILETDKENKELNLEKRNETLMKLLTEEDDHLIIQKEKRFCDFLWISVKSGKGGSPNYKVQRSKKLKGEGYGGHGGNVILKSKNSVYDLIKIEQKIKGNDGENFKENSRGKDGKDVIIDVPIGTIVRKRIYIKKKNINNRKIYKSIFWFQFLKENEEILVARGGKGGISYSYFKKHDYRLPENGEKVYLELELRLINDVAFIGIENSGKTSLCSALTKYYGNISDSPFSTTIPHISNINYIDGVQISLLDTPFLFFNAHKDKQKGRRILRHLFRSKLIVYVVDVSSTLLKNQDDSQIHGFYSKDQQNEQQKKNSHNNVETDINKEKYENFQKDVTTFDSDLERIDKEEININNDTISNFHTSAKFNDDMTDVANFQSKGNKQNEENFRNQENDDWNNLNNYHTDTIKQIRMLRNELYLYDKNFLKKKELVVATKCEMLHKNSLLNLDSLHYRLQNIFPHMEVIGTSAKFGLGIKLLSRKIRELIYPQYILQNEKWYAKNVEDYVIPTYTDFEKGKQRLTHYELPENIKHIYDFNYLENFDFFLRGKKGEPLGEKEEEGKGKGKHKERIQMDVEKEKDQTPLIEEKVQVQVKEEYIETGEKKKETKKIIHSK